MKLHNLEDVLNHELRDLYDAEKRIYVALSYLVRDISDSHLKQTVADHRIQTKEHIKRLTDIETKLNIELDGETCRGAQGLIKEAEAIQAADATPEARDTALIGALQRIEHYEMAAYMCAIRYAEILGLFEVSDLLNETLSEEEDADDKLGTIAQSGLNEKALYSDHGGYLNT